MCQTFENVDTVVQFYTELASPFYEDNHGFGQGVGEFISAHGALVSENSSFYIVLKDYTEKDIERIYNKAVRQYRESQTMENFGTFCIAHDIYEVSNSNRKT